MKNKIYILGLVTTLLVFIGILFKILHWPGAGVLLILGIFSLVIVFLPVALINNYKAEDNKVNRSLYIVTWITCLVVFIAMLFKIQHWPGASYLLLISVPFPFIIFLPVFLVITGKNKNFNINHTIAILFLLALISSFSALLSLNVSKERILDSLGISANYNRIEPALDKLPLNENQSEIIQKIDRALALTEEYQSLIFKNEGITREQWINDPGILMELSSRSPAANSILKGREGQVYMELQAILAEIIRLAGNDAVAGKLKDYVASILGMEQAGSGGQYLWTDALFKADIQPWAHAYLDGLETNLKMIKVSLSNLN